MKRAAPALLSRNVSWLNRAAGHEGTEEVIRLYVKHEGDEQDV
jgi:hypothetical protein